ncbi:hypothetical protein NP493_750g01061 [Ridgeia piscesae]|uniref:Deoxynucleoside kinase domain-containing protein n=1 Tax=Ridgeia piscesae TaxID=27915 RepID=A0AAD9NNN8_RIDPI|nr:hypothetical protein NP493_750g01061 [Ridgeia piscesae]
MTCQVFFCSAECYNGATIPIPQLAKKTFTVAVEGNIGSGKSSFLHYFDTSNSVEVVPEPVELWKSVRGHNTLELMYKDSERWSLTFQSYVQLTMLQVHTQKQTCPVKMIERSLYSARYCFVENLFRSGLMPSVDHAVLTEWFDWIVPNTKVGVDLFVYLRATPETCLERIRSRQRKEEAGVPLEYLETLHQLHDDWLIHQSQFKPCAPVLVVDADKEFCELKKDFERQRTDILCGYV